MNISEVDSRDLSAIKEIARDAVTSSVEATDSQKLGLLKGITSDIDEYCDKHPRCYLSAKDQNGHILGYILIKNHWNLAHLFVSPASHGKGIGRALLSRGILSCQGSENRGYLRVNSSLNAVKFYEKSSFSHDRDAEVKADFAIPLIYNFPE